MSVSYSSSTMHNSSPNTLLLGLSNQSRLDGLDMQYAQNKREMHAKFWSENLNGSDNLVYLKVHEMIILKFILKK
jgi:hypothetical protein